MNLERKLYKKRGLIGYNPAEVENKIHSLQNDYQNELERLKEKIVSEKEKNENLTANFEAFEMKPKENKVMDEVTRRLKEEFFHQTKEILAIKLQYVEKEKLLEEHFDQKQKQKELVQKRIQDALDYLNQQKEQLRKELNE